jgi:hypothetical protein
MKTPEKDSPQMTEIAALAQQLLDGKIGVSLASRRIRDLAWQVFDDPWKQGSLAAFLAIDTETDHLPLGKERSSWDTVALEAKDEEIAKCDAFYRDQAREAAERFLAESR